MKKKKQQQMWKPHQNGQKGKVEEIFLSGVKTQRQKVGRKKKKGMNQKSGPRVYNMQKGLL